MLKAGAAPLAVIGIMSQMTVTAHAQLSGWVPCPQFSNLSCAYFDIPLDYHNASAGNGQLLVVKANATAERKGTIFLNPGELAYNDDPGLSILFPNTPFAFAGGPGVSGLSSLATDAEALMNRTGGAYDFISWDPRGVGPYT